MAAPTDRRRAGKEVGVGKILGVNGGQSKGRSGYAMICADIYCRARRGLRARTQSPSVNGFFRHRNPPRSWCQGSTPNIPIDQQSDERSDQFPMIATTAAIRACDDWRKVYVLESRMAVVWGTMSSEEGDRPQERVRRAAGFFQEDEPEIDETGTYPKSGIGRKVVARTILITRLEVPGLNGLEEGLLYGSLFENATTPCREHVGYSDLLRSGFGCPCGRLLLERQRRHQRYRRLGNVWQLEQRGAHLYRQRAPS